MTPIVSYFEPNRREYTQSLLTGPLPRYLPEIAVKGSKELLSSGKVAT